VAEVAEHLPSKDKALRYKTPVFPKTGKDFFAKIYINSNQER
jgi:hypothetical protein